MPRAGLSSTGPAVPMNSLSSATKICGECEFVHNLVVTSNGHELFSV